MNVVLEVGGVYFLTVMFGVCVGVTVALADRWPQTLANIGITLAFLVVAAAVSGRWPWMVPAFLAAAILTIVSVEGARLRNHPMLQGVGFWRRTAMWILHGRRLAETEHAGP
ncbi:hypothetical protein [Microbacterium sp.]|uniref:hypothetical protein n=1 Tax=Microbacterium sp. TaxID=51671 RepID=UPI0035B0F3E8